MIRIKRSREHLDEYENEPSNEIGGLTSLEGDLKKVRISYTPGQLRLQKDMEEAKQKFNLKITLGENHSSCILYFPLNESKEVRFLLTVPRYYPHNGPIVKCLDFTTVLPFIDGAGNVVHRGLNEDWTAICTIDTIVQILSNICQTIRGSYMIS